MKKIFRLGLLAVLVYIPVYAQGVLGVSATESGLILIPMNVALFAAGIVIGQLTSRTGRYKEFMVGGTGVMLVGALLMTRLGGDSTPGALTLVVTLRQDAGIASLVTAGLDTVAIRVPAHPVAQDLLHAFGGVVAAPSGSRASSCTRLSGSAGSTRSTFSCSLSTSQLPEYSILKRSTAGCTRMITVPGAWRVTTATSRYGICANSWSDFSLVEKPYKIGRAHV